MQLCIDVGNSYTKMAVFSGRDLKHFVRYEKLLVENIEELEELFPIDQVIYLASGKDNRDALHHIKKISHHILLDHKTNMPIKIMYETPETLGRDRIASVMGAYGLFPGENIVVIDMGTCITYEILNKDGEYLGGNISPGVQMRLQAMHTQTAKLPLVEFGEVEYWIGTNTETAIRNGAVLGTILEIESFLMKAKVNFGDFRTVLTGGAADYFAKAINSEIFADQYLVHRGLNEILLFNDD